MYFDNEDDRDTLFEYGSEQPIPSVCVNHEFRMKEPPPGLLQGHKQYVSLVPIIRRVTNTSPSWRALPYSLENALCMRDILVCLKRGVVPENDAPYDPALVNVRPPREVMERAIPLQLTYMRVSSNINQLKGCILSGYPLLFSYARERGREERPGLEGGADHAAAAAGGGEEEKENRQDRLLFRPLVPAHSRRGYLVEVLIGFNDAESSFIALDPFHYSGLHLIPYNEVCGIQDMRRGAAAEGGEEGASRDYDFWCII